jgi:nucleotidyltransferase/DNA polymerase involved in DNA repair
MGIFAEKKELTRDELIKLEAERLRELNTNTLDFLKKDFEEKMKLIWHNQYGITPQEILNEFDKNSKSLFLKSAKVVNFIRSEDPTWIPRISRMRYVINADGTVTIL